MSPVSLSCTSHARTDNLCWPRRQLGIQDGGFQHSASSLRTAIMASQPALPVIPQAVRFPDTDRQGRTFGTRPPNPTLAVHEGRVPFARRSALPRRSGMDAIVSAFAFSCFAMGGRRRGGGAGLPLSVAASRRHLSPTKWGRGVAPVLHASSSTGKRRGACLPSPLAGEGGSAEGRAG